MVKVEGFKALKGDVTKQEVTVAFDPKKTNVQQLVKAINRGTHFQASVP